MPWHITLAVLAASSFLMSVTYTMLIPFLPMYLTQELHVAAADVNWWSGLCFSVTFLVSGLMAPIWGAMADRYSRKLMAVRASIALAITYFLAGMVQDGMQLFLVRLLQGFSSGLWPATLAIATTQLPREKIGFSLGLMQGCMTAGGVLGPLFGGLSAEYLGMRESFFWGAWALVLITILLVVYIKEPIRKKVPNAEKKPKGRSLLKVREIQILLFIASVIQLSMLMQQPILPQYITELQGDVTHIVLITGIVFSIAGLPGIFAAPVWGRIGENCGHIKILKITLFFTALFGVIQALPDDLWQFTGWRFMAGIAYAGIYPAINALFSELTEPDEKGRIYGYSYGFQQIGSVSGPLLGGFMATYLGYESVILLSGAIIFPLLLTLKTFKKA